MWVMAGYGGGQALRLVSYFILTRLLSEAAFGLMALVGVFLQGLQMMSDLGISQSVVQNERGDDPAFFRTGWSLQVARGLMLWCVCLVAARPFATFYGEEDLAWLIPLAGAGAIISGLNSSKLYRHNRHLALGRLTLLEFVSQCVGIAAMISWAVVDPSVIALVIGGLTGSTVRMAGSHLLLSGEGDRLFLDPVALRSLVTFGRWVFLSTVLYFFARQSDRLILGKLVPIASLGVYSIGAMISALPSNILQRLIRTVVFPVYSKVLLSGSSLSTSFGMIRRPFVLLTAWIVVCLIAGARPFVTVFFDARYADAAWVIELLAFGTWMVSLEATYGSALLAHGLSRWTAMANGARLVSIGILMPLGFSLFGMAGAVGGFALSGAVMYGVSAVVAHRLGLTGWILDLVLSTSIAASVVVIGGLCHLTSTLWDSPILQLVLVAALSTAFWGFPTWSAWNRFKSM